MPTIYLDACCLNRPFDDQSQPCVHLEAEAVLIILARLKTREFMKRFEEQFGSTNCRMLLGCDLGTTEGQQTFQTNHLIEHCFEYAEDATRIALSILENQA